MKLSKKFAKIALIFFLLIAYIFFSFMVFKPLFTRTSGKLEAESVAAEFLEATRPTTTFPAEPTESANPSATDLTEARPTEEQPTAPTFENAELFAAMQAYNEKIRAEGQMDLCDPWSYTVPALDLSSFGLEKNAVIGVLQIPCIDVKLPIYMGASYMNLDKGAAVLSQTSLPIGGDNTNCVIGAHRGWNAEDFLRDIEDVQLGDIVTVTNLWEELQYSVAEIKIIRPDNIEQVLIQEGRELLTVFTCHPYASRGQYRYLLICERVQQKAPSFASESPTESKLVIPSTVAIETKKSSPTVCIDGMEFKSAKDEIQIVSALPWFGLAVSLLLLSILIISLVHSIRLHRRRKD